MDGTVLALTLGAALGFAVAAALKHASAGHLPHLERFTLRGVGKLVTWTVRHPLWLAGTAADVLAVSLQTLALRRGELAVIQPLLVTQLVFALLVRAIGHRRLAARELWWGVVLSAAVAGFLAVADPTTSPSADVDRGPAIGAAVVGLVLAIGCVAAARTRFAGRGAAAASYGVAAGIGYATTAALLKTLTGIARRGIPAVLGSWQLYTVLAVGAAALVLTQLAYQAGPLAASLPTITIVNPLLSIVIGVAVYDEQLRPGLGAGVAMGVLLLLTGLAVLQLSRQAAWPRSEAASGV